MTTKEKARAYEAALERAKYYQKENGSAVISAIFPELSESDDEKVRKALVKYFTLSDEHAYNETCGVSYKDIVAWLEKQKELTSDEEKQGKEDVLWCINQAKKYAKDENEMGTCWFAEKWLEKQGDSAIPQVYETKNGEVITYSESEGYKVVEPKFKNGQWIVWKDKCYKVNYNACGYELFDENGWSTSWDYKTIEDNAHIWTIQDAKDGDVLFQDLMDGMTFIYCGINPHMAILYSFIISNDGEDVLPYHIGKPNTGIGNIEENKNIIYPATKEQRDFLFQKMKEAGYEWDAEKKELKKIDARENLTLDGDLMQTDSMVIESSWNEEDEKMVEDALQFAHEYGRHGLWCWLKSLKGRVQPQPKQGWSNVDKKHCQMLQNIICDSGASAYLANKLSDWLNSLKDRIN